MSRVVSQNSLTPESNQNSLTAQENNNLIFRLSLDRVEYLETTADLFCQLASSIIFRMFSIFEFRGIIKYFK